MRTIVASRPDRPAGLLTLTFSMLAISDSAFGQADGTITSGSRQYAQTERILEDREEASQEESDDSSDDQAQEASTPPTLAPLTVIGRRQSDDTHYNALNSKSALRTEVPLKQTPLAVDVTTAKELRDRQLTELDEALQKTSGVQVSMDSPLVKQYRIRGYEAALTSDGLLGSTPLDGVERIEVIKGPDVLAGGAGGAGYGGVVNLVRKKPIATPLRNLTLELADHGEFKQVLDLGGALSADDSVTSRFVLANAKSDRTAPDYHGEHSLYLAPSLGWHGGDLKLVVGADYQRNREAAPRTSIAIDGRVLDLPSERLEPKDAHYAQQRQGAYYELDYALGADWTLSSQAQFYRSENVTKLWSLIYVDNHYCAPDEAAGRGLGSVCFGLPYNDLEKSDRWATRNQITGTIKTGAVTHNLLLGYDFTLRNSKLDELLPDLAGAYPNVSVYRPNSFDELPHVPNQRTLAYRSELALHTLVLQNQLDIGQDLHLLLSLKRSRFELDNDVYNRQGQYVRSNSTHIRDWLPNYGIAYDLTPQVTLYANWLKAMASPQMLRDEALPPTQLHSKELGVKADLFGQALTLTATYFDIARDNVAIIGNFYNLIALQSIQSRGVEFDLAGKLSPGWEISTNYTRSWFDNAGEGGAFIGQSSQVFNLWSRYQIQSGKLAGFGGGIGVSAFSSTMAGYDAPFKRPGGTTTDVSLFKQAADYSITLGVTNLFDRKLYENGNSLANYIPLRQGREWRLTASYDF